jgi:hypothetical protein
MNLYETIQDFPSGIPITDVELTTTNAVGQNISAFTFKREIQVFPGARWGLRMNFLPMNREEAGALEGFIRSLRGPAGRFRMGDPYQSLPRGQNLGFPVVAAAIAGSEYVDIVGWVPNRADQLKANDFVQIGDHLYSVLCDVGSDGNGFSRVKLWPPLRASYETGTPMKTSNARGVFALASGEQSFTRNTLQEFGTTIEAMEVIS